MRPFWTVAVIGFGTTVFGASKVLTLSTFGAGQRLAARRCRGDAGEARIDVGRADSDRGS